MLTNYEYATGVKTGYTKKSGRCLVSSSDKDGFKLICVVLNCAPMFERSQELLNSTYNLYKRTKLVDCETAVGEVTNKKGQIVPVYVKNDLYYPLAKNELDEVKKVIIPINKNQISQKFASYSGRIEIFFKKDLIFNEKIYTII